jgi:hypothetical protein
LRGTKITNPLGDSSLTPEGEKNLIRKYVKRALDILQTDPEEDQVFTLDGTR